MSSKAPVGGWRAVFGSTSEALAMFRISLGFILICELLLRFRFLHVFYTDEGAMPLRLLLPHKDNLYKAVCLHCHFGELWQQQILLSIQAFVAVLFTLGYQTRIMSIVSWFLYTSLILRNTWLYFILDRYFYYLLFYSMFLPLDEKWSLREKLNANYSGSRLIVSPATVALKLLVFWIYLDAGGGKYMDPLQGWTYNAKPLPALDTYTRHTLGARYIYSILGPQGLRIMTPLVVYIELLAAPLAFLGAGLGSPGLIKFAVALICQLHVGISFSIRNAVLLSYVACVPWCVFLPIGWEESSLSDPKRPPVTRWSRLGNLVSLTLVGSLVIGNIWFETIGADCSHGSTEHIWSTILHNRWNVFIGAEEYVTWEIAPGMLADGSVVDVWGRKDEVEWNMPGTGAPCTSTARPGRWRSFPYLAEFEGEEAEVLWGYLCKQWDQENNVDNNAGRKLLRYKFYMLQADVLPNMGFSSTRKRLIRSFECVPEESTTISAIEDETTEALPGDENDLSEELDVEEVKDGGKGEL